MTGRDRGAEDAYQVLGVAPGATSADISRAYRRLARELHPDAQPADANAAARFRAVTAAHELLSHPERKEARGRRTAPGPASPGAQPPPGTDPGRPAPRAGRPASRYPPRPGAAPTVGAAVRAGPVRIEPLPGQTHDPHRDTGITLADLLELIGRRSRDRGYRAW